MGTGRKCRKLTPGARRTLAAKPEFGQSPRMGLAKFFTADATEAALTAVAAQTLASSLKGVNAFQRGKCENTLKELQPAA